MMTVKEVAEQLGVSRGLVYKLVRTGHLESYRIGAAIRISPEHLQRYLEQPPSNGRPRRFRHLRF